ncbi:MAG: cellulose biosynthesis protein BcsE [Sulfuricellaceae bacterium]|nr:cellulose biosynthesis protein BcsE [Sulfuricellaceae bacterium]
MPRGSDYIVVHDECAPILGVAWPTLRAAGISKPAQWITERDPERELASPLPQADAMRRALSGGRVKSFQWGNEKLPDLLRILEELDYFGAGKGGLTVIDGADRFFDGASPEQADGIAEACQEWAKQKACALLLLCTRRVGRSDPAEALRQAAHRLGGFARFRRSDDSLSWDVFHWFGVEGIVADRSFRLSAQADGGMAVEKDDLPLATFELAVDEDAVFITRAVLPGKQPPPATWRVVEDFDALGAAVAATAAATIILHYDQSTPLDVLARTVFSLRQSRGIRIKIVVREVNVRMRYSQEQLFMRLGANLVVPPEVGFSRFLSLVGMVQGQIFSRPLQADYETAVAGIALIPERGYLEPQAFIEAVAAAMERVRVLDIQNVLIRLPLAPGLSPLDTLRYCLMKRPGDLCTADEESVYVFLFACRESDVGLTLDRVFRLPVPELFEGEVRYFSPETIRQAMETLTAQAADGKLTDLSPALAAATLEQPAPEAKSAPSENPDNIVQRRAPSPAVRRPLSLRVANPVVVSS